MLKENRDEHTEQNDNTRRVTTAMWRAAGDDNHSGGRDGGALGRLLGAGRDHIAAAGRRPEGCDGGRHGALLEATPCRCRSCNDAREIGLRVSVLCRWAGRGPLRFRDSASLARVPEQHRICVLLHRPKRPRCLWQSDLVPRYAFNSSCNVCGSRVRPFFGSNRRATGQGGGTFGGDICTRVTLERMSENVSECDATAMMLTPAPCSSRGYTTHHTT